MNPLAREDGNPVLVVLIPGLLGNHVECPIPVGVIGERARTHILIAQPDLCTGGVGLEKDAVCTRAGRCSRRDGCRHICRSWYGSCDGRSAGTLVDREALGKECGISRIVIAKRIGVSTDDLHIILTRILVFE